MPFTVHPKALIVQELPPSEKKHEHSQTRFPPLVPRTQMQQEPWVDLDAASSPGASMMSEDASTYRKASFFFMVPRLCWR
jgi:hypothetical protein